MSFAFSRRTAFNGIFIALAFLPVSLYAQPTDSPAEREKAAGRYFALYPVRKMVEDAVQQITFQLPPPQREQYTQALTQGVRLDVVERAATASLVKNFSLDELNALVAFAQNPAGHSALEKMKLYSIDMMPVLQQEFMRAQAASQGYGAPGMPPGYPVSPQNGGGYPPGGYPPPPSAGYPQNYQQPGYPPQGGYGQQNYGGGYPPPGYPNRPN